MGHIKGHSVSLGASLPKIFLCLDFISPLVCFEAGSRQTQTLNEFPAVASDFDETLQGRSFDKYLQTVEGIFYIYCQSKDMADFLNLRGKLEPPTLINIKTLVFQQFLTWE